MKSIIISNFKPILVGKLIDQQKLNQYTKFLYHHFQHLGEPVEDLINEMQIGPSSFDEISNQVDKYSIPSQSINKRQILIFEEVEDFLENKMETTSPSDYDFPSTLETKTGNTFGPKIGVRMEWFKKKWVMFLTSFIQMLMKHRKI
ncbi:hypothetical protein [Flavobacterium sp. ACAM 123]|jgi:hypothetical protein|uniref:hypothetical protein n=1 Tax=Flavobacterium sp. ACAM 123 TaxID=1189620 RepID=UPI0002FCFE09|nr:hypothetical protein [Flavobacterium sp. ACAM 123]